MKEVELGKKIINTLNNSGYEAYFVGGFVRDYILGRKINDIDIATDAKPETVMNIFKKTIPTGLKHGTVMVIIENFPYEVTTFRAEGEYLDFRHPENVQFVTSLYQDLSRRDFTMNAIVMDLNERIIDPFNGIDALNNKLITAVGNANERFLEDPLRMLRAIRFAAQLNFSISKETWNALIANSKFIKHIAAERIKAELDKIMDSERPDIGIKLIHESELINHFKAINGIDINKIDLRLVLPLLREKNDSSVRWALYLKNLSNIERQHFFKQLRFSKKEKNEIINLLDAYELLVKGLSTNNIKKCLITFDKKYCINAIFLLSILKQISLPERKKAEQKMELINNNLTAKEIKDLAITGKDLIETFHDSGGPWVKEILEQLFKSVIYDELPNDRIHLIDKAKELYYRGKRTGFHER